MMFSILFDIAENTVQERSLPKVQSKRLGQQS